MTQLYLCAPKAFLRIRQNHWTNELLKYRVQEIIWQEPSDNEWSVGEVREMMPEMVLFTPQSLVAYAFERMRG